MKTSLFNILVGLTSIQLAASSNYIINEWLDRNFDKYNPKKKFRPSVIGTVSKKNVYLIYFFNSILTIYLSSLIGLYFLYLIIFFLFMGIVYNVKPFRAKDIQYLDIFVESINNPIRLLLGYFIFNTSMLLPSSIIIFYWSAGAFLMTCKRYAEYNSLDRDILIKYRKSFKGYNINKLLLLIFFTSLLSISMLTVFMIKYKIEFIFFIIAVICLYIYYLSISLEPNSSVQNIDYLYNNKYIYLIIFFCLIVFVFSASINLDELKILEKRIQLNY